MAPSLALQPAGPIRRQADTSFPEKTQSGTKWGEGCAEAALVTRRRKRASRHERRVASGVKGMMGMGR